MAGAGSEPDDDAKDLTSLRRAIFSAIYVLFVAYTLSCYAAIPGWPVPVNDSASDLELAQRIAGG